MSLLQTLLIGLAGAIGAVARYLTGQWIISRVKSVFPLATLSINIVGSFLAGLLFSMGTHHLISPTLQAIVTTGFLGGYTTFSTMCWEGWHLARNHMWWRSQLYMLSSLLLGLIAAALGIYIGGVVL